jgi:hypothetical protein
VIAEFRGFGVDTPHYSLSVIDMNGDTLRSGRISSRPIIARPEDIDRIIEEQFSYMLENDELSRAALISTVRGQTDVPTVFSPVSSFNVSEDGSIWITGPHRNHDSATVVVLDGVEFDTLGEAVLPSNITLLWASMDEAWGTARGEWDESYVVRLVPRWTKKGGPQRERIDTG